jgi:hypothetical protein
MQARNVDFSQAQATRPFKMGGELPSVCLAGDAFYKTTAPPGANWYSCSGANSWILQSSGGNYRIDFTSASEVTVSAEEHGLTAEKALIECYDAATPAQRVETDGVSADPAAGSITVRFSLPQTGYCVLAGPVGGSGEPTATGAVSSVFGRLGAITKSKGDYALADLGDVDGKHGSSRSAQMFGGGAVADGDCARFDDAGNIVSAGQPCGTGGGGTSVLAGPGIVAAGNTVAVDTAAVPAYLTQTAALTFPAMASGACSPDLTFPLLGAAAGDSVAAGWPGTLDPGLIGMMRVSNADTIAVRLCNVSAAGIPGTTLTYRATIVRSF